MNLELTDWDQDVATEADEEFQALVRTLKLTEGFGLIFVRCSPVEGEQIIAKVKEDIPNKNIEVLPLEKPVDNFYNIVENLDNKANIDILFIKGLEKSLYQYEECKKLAGWNSRDIYSYSWKGVPPVLTNLNQQRERFRDNFNICFVFLLPLFAIKYFIQRAPDFFDWRSGLFEFPTDAETVEQESVRLLMEADYEKYLALTPEEKTQEILKIQELLEENHQIPSYKAELLSELGNLFAAAQQYEEALASYNKAIEIKPDYHYAWSNRGKALGNLGRYEEALAAYDKAIEIKPDDASIWYLRSDALKNLGRYEEALASYDKVIEIKPEDAYSWSLRGIALHILGRYEEALAACDKGIEIKPDYYIFWYIQGIVLKNLGRYEEALASYDKAIEIKSDYYIFWNNRGIVLNHLGRYEEAHTSFDKAIEIKPDDAYAWYIWGMTLYILGRYEEALAAFDKGIEIKPDYHIAWYIRGDALGNLGRYEEALASYDKAIEIKPDDADAWDSRGNALSKLGRWKEANVSFKKAAEINPGFLTAQFKAQIKQVIADVLKKLGWQKLTRALTGLLKLIGFRR